MNPLLALFLLVAHADEPAPLPDPADTAEPTDSGDTSIHASEPHPGPGQDPNTPQLQEPFPFDHGAHAGAFKRVKVVCVDCHPVGLTTKEEGSFAWPGDEVPHPYTNCHACHRHEVEGAPRSARGLCLQCHAYTEEIVPETHDLGWLQTHGLAARTPGNNCEDCHTSSRCIACHDDRGALSESPHGPGFYAYHGIEARMDPRKCSTCHESTTCTTCHESGVLPW